MGITWAKFEITFNLVNDSWEEEFLIKPQTPASITLRTSLLTNLWSWSHRSTLCIIAFPSITNGDCLQYGPILVCAVKTAGEFTLLSKYLLTHEVLRNSSERMLFLEFEVPFAVCQIANISRERLDGDRQFCLAVASSGCLL